MVFVGHVHNLIYSKVFLPDSSTQSVQFWKKLCHLDEKTVQFEIFNIVEEKVKTLEK